MSAYQNKIKIKEKNIKKCAFEHFLSHCILFCFTLRCQEVTVVTTVAEPRDDREKDDCSQLKEKINLLQQKIGLLEDRLASQELTKRDLREHKHVE